MKKITLLVSILGIFALMLMNAVTGFSSPITTDTIICQDSDDSDSSDGDYSPYENPDGDDGSDGSEGSDESEGEGSEE